MFQPPASHLETCGFPPHSGICQVALAAAQGSRCHESNDGCSESFPRQSVQLLPFQSTRGTGRMQPLLGCNGAGKQTLCLLHSHGGRKCFEQGSHGKPPCVCSALCPLGGSRNTLSPALAHCPELGIFPWTLQLLMLEIVGSSGEGTGNCWPGLWGSRGQYRALRAFTGGMGRGRIANSCCPWWLQPPLLLLFIWEPAGREWASWCSALYIPSSPSVTAAQRSPSLASLLAVGFVTETAGEEQYSTILPARHPCSGSCRETPEGSLGVPAAGCSECRVNSGNRGNCATRGMFLRNTESGYLQGKRRGMVVSCQRLHPAFLKLSCRAGVVGIPQCEEGPPPQRCCRRVDRLQGR
ncbi:NACHT, LRR and PYD domains-containing protein 3-like [Platysternon megacephalum]|uniref:NACHT, LRR and PYD domains-containing protein 3-like n=1 Tax=Platysternon megacephalum TaxID=55544 RepID=A0A4D9DQP5_9SAUR|nr:NACHT, LRR and PYD domains-containing protein 3-like [Platysternon megacephalum]